MEFADIKYTKTVEGNYEVQLVHNNTIVAQITFPTELLAAEYVDFKQKLKAHADAVIDEVASKLTKTEEAVQTEAVKETAKAKSVEGKVKAAAEKLKEEVVKEVEAVETRAEEAVVSIRNKIEKIAPIDTSAKVAVQQPIDTSVKVGKDTVIDTSAKIVVP